MAIRTVSSQPIRQIDSNPTLPLSGEKLPLPTLPIQQEPTQRALLLRNIALECTVDQLKEEISHLHNLLTEERSRYNTLKSENVSLSDQNGVLVQRLKLKEDYIELLNGKIDALNVKVAELEKTGSVSLQGMATLQANMEQMVTDNQMRDARVRALAASFQNNAASPAIPHKTSKPWLVRVDRAILDVFVAAGDLLFGTGKK